MASTQEARITNNIFRMLPSEIMAEIREMRKFVPTPSATAIQEADPRLSYEIEDYPLMGWVMTKTVSIPPRNGANFRKREVKQYYEPFVGILDHETVYETNFLEFPLYNTPPWVISEWTGTRVLHDAWLNVQREQAEASGMF